MGELDHALEVLAALILNYPQYPKLSRIILRAACLLKVKGRLEESESYFTYLQEMPPHPLPEHAILFQLAFVTKMRGKQSATLWASEGEKESKFKGSTSMAGAAFREARARERQWEAVERARRKRKREVQAGDKWDERKKQLPLPALSATTAAAAAAEGPNLPAPSLLKAGGSEYPKRRPAPMAVTMRDYAFWEARAVEMFRAGFFVCASESFQQGISLVTSSSPSSSSSSSSSSSALDEQSRNAALRCNVVPMLAGLCVCFLRAGERDE